MDIISIVLPIVKFILDIFIKDKDTKTKFVSFIEGYSKRYKSSVELSDDYKRQVEELNKPPTSKLP